MNKVIYPNYLYSVKLPDIDNAALYDMCIECEPRVIGLARNDQQYVMTESLSTQNFRYYNILTVPQREVLKVYDGLRASIAPMLKSDIAYSIQAWFNVYRAGQSIRWHVHWPAGLGVWHGFYCVSVGNGRESATHYRIPGTEEIKIDSEDGLLVFGKSEGDQHCSTPWIRTDYHRVTIAFDIVPISIIPDQLSINHFLPFKS